MFRVSVVVLFASTLSACAMVPAFVPTADVAPSTAQDLSALKLRAASIGETNRLAHIAQLSENANAIYSKASVSSDNAELRGELQALAADRAELAQSLNQRVTALGGDPQVAPNPTESVSGAIGTARSDGSLEASEVYRGESVLIAEIGQALDGDLSPESRQLLEAELQDAEADRTRLQRLQARIQITEDAARAAADAEADAFHEQPG
jgi:hypothetical protein